MKRQQNEKHNRTELPVEMIIFPLRHFRVYIKNTLKRFGFSSTHIPTYAVHIRRFYMVATLNLYLYTTILSKLPCQFY